MTPRLFFPDLLNKNTSLDYKQTHYLKNVLRIKEGEKIVIFDGNGNEAVAHIKKIEKKKIEIELGTIQKISKDPPVKLIVGQCLCLSNKMDYVVQKSVELGAYSIIPLISSRSQFKLNESRSDAKILRWKKIANAASQQCGRTIETKIEPPTQIEKFFISSVYSDSSFIKWIMDPDGKESVSTAHLSKNKNILITVGPEAGFSDKEDILAKKFNFIPVKFGKRILRTETAAVATLAVINHRLGEL